ncbi:hypothetical protein GS482_30250 [Rhodococcus hoagii]|nr:hypothetical protein [Prescottella equi]
MPASCAASAASVKAAAVPSSGGRVHQQEKGTAMDFPPIWWLMPYGFVPDPIRYWVLDNAPCWLGGYCP